MNQHLVSPRYNVYALVHKGLRAYMMDTLARVGRTDWQNDDHCASTLTDVRSLALVCQSHLEHENEFLHTAMAAREPGSVNQAHDDHLAHEIAITRLLRDCDCLAQSPRSARAPLGHLLYGKLAVFIAENFQHMAMEETAHNAVLWRHYRDDELIAIEQAIKAHISPEKALVFLRWMLSATQPAERLHILQEMQVHAPAVVYQAVLNSLQPMLSDTDWQTLQRSLAQPLSESGTTPESNARAHEPSPMAANRVDHAATDAAVADRDFADCDPAELDAVSNLQRHPVRAPQAA